jgi:hypothetical protein
LSKKEKSVVVCLILSVDKSPWKEIQEFGQNETFVNNKNEDLVFLRYLGHDTVLPTKARLALTFKAFQYWAFLKFSRFGVLGALSNISLLRLGDNTLRETHSWGLPETHLRQESKSGSSKYPDTIVTQTHEHHALVGLKTLQAFQFVLNNYDFDFIFRTNTSSYVDGDLLLDLTKNLGEGHVLGGVTGETRFGAFASGAGILISKSLVIKIVEQGHQWRHGLIDDIALSRLVMESLSSEVSLTPLARIDFDSLGKVKKAKDGEIASAFHFRCKTKSPEETVEIMKEIWRRKNKK